ncbi:hemin ABC transporter substrate-binding protein [Thalassospira sp. TSL5-1]|uniref:heme/hemin ABC transporter substrate-binding protein n=1 Tax=Thalassospira sp. TSL5-1 TaxID=1544451 RepID=UPI00093DB535|nr:ABC transporter substrate-binding protein [Thalassospira sp. TSL5-1]OKH87526.1 hypothetical protein LF95_12120 [Thalassospira sp. TSL5-1]
MRSYLLFIAAIIGLLGLCFPAFAQGTAVGRAKTPPQRIVTVGAPATEIVYALGAGKNVVAVDITSTWPKDVQSLPRVGYMRTLAAEGIISLRPDIIIAIAESGPEAALDRLRELGVAVVLLPSLNRIENLPAAIDAVSSALGRDEAGAKLRKKVEGDITAIHALAGANNPEKEAKGRPENIVFLMSVGHGQPMSAGQNTTANEIIDLVGAENPMVDYEGFKPVSPEIIAANRADYVLVTSSTLDQLGGIAGLQASPVFGLHPAVARGHVLSVSASTILGFGPRSADEIRQIATRLHQFEADQ